MTLLQIANKVMSNDEIGSVPVYGADAQWFVNQFQEVIKLHPEAEAWDEHKIYTTMCFLYLMDPEDFISWSVKAGGQVQTLAQLLPPN
jgi:hypothetical protein